MMRFASATRTLPWLVNREPKSNAQPLGLIFAIVVIGLIVRFLIWTKL